MKDLFYILKDKKPIPTDSTTAMENYSIEKRKVAKDKIGDILISTVFLGIDHAFDNGPPVLFETMVFGGGLDEEMERYSTWEEAEAGHAAMVEKVKKALKKP